MRVSINQPAYIPWPGYFHRIAISDLHIILDDVQFEKGSMVNRNKIRTKQGWQWLTIPVTQKLGTKINELEIKDDRWCRRHWKSIEQNYKKAQYWKNYMMLFWEMYLPPNNPEWFLECVAVHLPIFLDELDINTDYVLSSYLKIKSTKSDLVLDLCKEVGATEYISGPFGRDYLELNKFKDAGIKVVFHDYKPPVYKQVYDGFEPYMSVLDLLFNCGPRAREVMFEGNDNCCSSR